MSLNKPGLFTTALGRLSVIGELPSRRNSVLFAADENGRRLIVKRYLQNSMETERRLLKRLAEHGVPVPAIIGTEEGFLLLEYIKGINLCELLEICEAGDDIDRWASAVGALADWLCLYYAAFETPVLRDDINLRNFILSGQTVFGVDFETCPPGRPETDAGRIIAFTLCYNPPFTHFKRRAAALAFDEFSRRLSLDEEALRGAVAKELEQIKIRRGQDIPIELFNFPDRRRIL